MIRIGNQLRVKDGDLYNIKDFQLEANDKGEYTCYVVFTNLKNYKVHKTAAWEVQELLNCGLLEVTHEYQ